MDWIRVPGDGATIRTAEQDLSSAGLDAGAIEHLHQRYADPLRGAHGSQAPLLSLDWRIEQRAAVAGALERDDECLRRHLPKVAHAETERALHQAAHRQTKDRRVEIGNLKVIADVEMCAWHHDPAHKRRDGGFTIERIGTVHDQPGFDGVLACVFRIDGGDCFADRQRRPATAAGYDASASRGGVDVEAAGHLEGL
jgi:hypothetical protein